MKITRPAIYGDKSLKLAFEFGLVLSETAKTRKIELTPEISARAEEIFIKELRSRGLKKTAIGFLPLILATLEV